MITVFIVTHHICMIVICICYHKSVICFTSLPQHETRRDNLTWVDSVKYSSDWLS